MNKDFLTFRIMEKVGLSESFNGIVWTIRKIPLIGRFLGDKYNFSEPKQVIHSFYPIFVILKNLFLSIIGFSILVLVDGFLLSTLYDMFGGALLKVSEKSLIYEKAYYNFMPAFAYIAVNIIRDPVGDNIDKVKKFSQSFYLDPKNIVRALIYFKPIISFISRSIVFVLAFKFMASVNPLVSLLVSFDIYLLELFGSGFWLRNNHIHGKTFLNSGPFKFIVMLVVLLGLNFRLAFTDFSRTFFLIVLTIVSFVGGFWAISYVKNFDGYGAIVERAMKNYDEVLDKAENIDQTRVKLKDSDIVKKDSNKEGFAYLNDLFFARHRRILRKPVLIKTLIFAVLLLVAFVATFYLDNLDLNAPDLLIRLVPLISYIICKQANILTAFYLNCDMGLMLYGFYKDPKNLLSMYKERLISIFKINLIPSLVFILGFLAFSLKDEIRNPVFLLEGSIYILLAGLFFTGLPLAQYYLLQPFDAEGKKVGKLSMLVDFGVYYFAIYGIGITANIKTSSLVIGVSIFIALFLFLTSFLIVKIGPKTFRVKN